MAHWRPDGRLWWMSPWRLHITLAAMMIAVLFLFGNPFERTEFQWFDQSLRWRSQTGGARPVDKRILHLDITASDLKNLSGRQGEYAAAARLVREASALGARILVFDTIYGRESSQMAAPILEAIRTSSASIVFAEGLSPAPGSGMRGDRVRSFPFLPSRLTPAGIINIQPDADGVYRHYPLFQAGPSGLEPSLALAAYLVSKGVAWPEGVTFSKSKTASWQMLSADGTRKISQEIGIDPKRILMLDMRSRWEAEGPSAFPHLSLAELHELYQSAQPQGRRPLAGKILFIAYVASGVGDYGATPLGGHQPLVQLHSTAFNDLVQQTSHMRLPRWGDALFLVSVLLMGWTGRFAGSKIKLILFWFLGVVGVTAVDLLLLWRTGWVIPFVAWVVVWTMAGVVEILRRQTVELVEQEKVKQELHIAHEIQQNFLPDLTRSSFGVDVVARSIPALAVGGDFYDVLQLDDARTGIVIGDVSGKGVPAALYMVRAILQYRFLAPRCPGPADLLKQLNQEFVKDSHFGMFLTLLYVIFDRNQRTLQYASAGHQWMIRRSIATGTAEMLEGERGLPLGLGEGGEYSQSETRIASGDAVVLYTDGITEARDKFAQEYSVERLKKCLQTQGQNAGDYSGRILNDVQTFTSGAKQHDDMTLLTLLA